MTTRVVGAPIGGVDSWIEELAHQFVEGAKGEAAAFVKIRDLEAKIEENEKGKAENLATAEQLKAKLKSAQSDLDDAEAMKVSPFDFGALKETGEKILAALLTIAMVIPGLTFVWWKSKSARDAAVSAAEEVVDDLKKKLKTAETNAKNHGEKIESMKAEIESTRPSQGIEAIGRVYFPVQVVDMAGKKVLVDKSGLHAKREVRIPDLASDPNTMKRIKSAVKGAQGLPILLRRADETANEVDALQGEEIDLKNAIDEFTDLVSSIPIHSCDLPLIENNEDLSTALAEDSHSIHDEVPGVVLRGEDESQIETSLSTLNDVATRLQSMGDDADAALMESYGDLKGILDTYSELRTSALHSLHTNLLEAMSHSDMLAVHYFCPQCNRVPEYLFWKIGIRIEDAHMANQGELLSKLLDDSVIAERLHNQQNIVTELANAHRCVSELENNVASVEAELNAASSTVGADLNLSAIQASKTRHKAFVGQLAQALSEYQGHLRHAVTGSKQPSFEFSHQARLFRDPYHGTWSCGACNTEFDDPQVVNMGRMLKTKADLMMPMWNALWTEKDDFRKSELFRTNEAMQQMSEKESEKLIDVSNQYKADMRPIRENLIRYAGDAETKQTQLFDTLESLKDIGLLDAQKAQQVRDNMDRLLGQKIGDAKRSAENKELLLNKEPQAQTHRRPACADPIDYFITPDTLFRQVAPSHDMRINRAQISPQGGGDAPAAMDVESGAQGESEGEV